MLSLEDSNRIHKDKQEKLRERGQRRNFDDELAPGSHGVVIHNPVGYNPNPNARNFGKMSSGTHGVPDIFGQNNGYGMRRDDMMFSQGFSPKGKVFLGHEDTFLMEEGTLIGSNHQSGAGNTVDVCDISCGPTEFFCTKSCSCIQNDLHCGKYVIKIKEFSERFSERFSES
jgi:hypothetical protein